MTAVLLALAAALSFAIATVMQHRGAADTARDGVGSTRMLGPLLRRPAWLIGQATAGLGFVLHGAALRGGLVVIVQPLLSSGLVLTLALGALVDRRHPGRPLPGRAQWTAAGVVAVGLALFATTARPTSGRASAPTALLAACVIASLLIAVAAHLWGRHPGATHRATVFGVATGVGFAITGLLLKELVGLPPGSWATTWTTPALLLTGGVSVLMAQRAYQAGPLVESVPVMAVLEPVVASALAYPLYGERLAPGLLAHTAQTLGALMLVVGLVWLARRSAGSEQPNATEGGFQQPLSA